MHNQSNEELIERSTFLIQKHGSLANVVANVQPGPLGLLILGGDQATRGLSNPEYISCQKYTMFFNIDQKVLFSKYCDNISNLKFLTCSFSIREKLKTCSFLLRHFMAISCSHYVTISILIFYSHKRFYILLQKKFILNLYSTF